MKSFEILREFQERKTSSLVNIPSLEGKIKETVCFEKLGWVAE
jgi:hypothetical protein